MTVETEERIKIKHPARSANHHLKRVTRLLFGIGVAGQWLFVYYIVAFYGGVVVNGTYEKINEQLPHGIIEGDTFGNIMLAIHLFLAAYITFGGPLQFIPAIRNRFPKFHRWNGRVYFTTAFVIALAGMAMNFTRGAHGGLPGMLGNSLNAVLIMSFSVLAWRTAMQKQFQVHKKWALRAFLMVSGVWFFRIGYGLWLLLSGFTMPGTSADLNGPFDIFLMFAHSLLPLLLLEFYFYAKAHPGQKLKRTATGIFALLCILLAGGIAMATMIFWLPAL